MFCGLMFPSGGNVHVDLNIIRPSRSGISMKVAKVFSGTWYPLRHTRQVLICCDCGLVHEVDFDLVKGKTGLGTQIFQLQLRAKVKKKMTREWRKTRKL
jgi:hypothetical protein